jgi:LPXTG-site transpeptidase (sortase) family protein
MATKNLKKRKPSLFTSPALFVLIGCIGIALVVSSNFYRAYKRWQYSFAVTPPVTSLAIDSQLPIQIRLPQIGISLPITEGDISNGVWLVSSTGATHLVRSAVPGTEGNIVIYGHNTDAIFGRLHLIQKGHTILVTTKDGAIHRYIVSNLLTVPPSRVDLVLPTKTEILTIYTCTGFFDSERLVIQAVPEI